MCDVAASFFPLSFLPLHWSLSLFPISSSISHVTACVRGNEQKFLLASWLIPPIPSRIHSSTINHPPFITDSISHTPRPSPALRQFVFVIPWISLGGNYEQKNTNTIEMVRFVLLRSDAFGYHQPQISRRHRPK